MQHPRPRKDPDFDGSADMRLVELQRAALGVAAPARSAWESDAHTEGSSAPVSPEPVLESAVLAAELTANPPADVIPGAVVTLALSIANEGSIAARAVRVAVPLPGGATYRSGSFVRDGRPVHDNEADAFFGTGLQAGTLAPKTRATFLWKIGVRLGNKPLVMTPLVDAEDTAIVGAAPVIISRREEALNAFAGELQRYDQPVSSDELPIYELDEEEIIEHEAADAALSGEYRPGIEPPLQPVPPPDQPEPIPPPDQPAPVWEPGEPVVEPSIPPPPEMPPDFEPAAAEPPAAARTAVVLYGQLDRPSIAYFERIWSGPKPATLLNHFILGGALACTRDAGGHDVAGLKAHMDAQAQLLQRAVLHEKMGKKEPIAEYTGSMLARVDQFVPAPVVPRAPSGDENVLLLESELETPALSLLRKMQDESARWDFTKARQLTLALQAHRVASHASPELAEAAETALRAYAQTAATQLQRFFVRMRIDRTTGLLGACDETLDKAARTLIAALVALF
jgi:hypothetical protein